MSTWLRSSALVLLAGCAVGPRWKRPDPPATAAYTRASEPRDARVTTDMAVPAAWWRALECASLDRLVDAAIADSPSLEAARATLAKSQDALRAGYGLFSPQADANVGAARQQVTPTRYGVKLAPSVFNLFSLSATVSYALDLWGGQRRTVESLRAQAEAAHYRALGAYEVLAGNVATTVIAIAAYRDEIATTRQLVAIEAQQAALAETQARAGTTPYVNALSLESQAELTRATLPGLAQKLAQAEHLLASLVGRAPADFQPPQLTLTELHVPARLPLTLPSQLVRQRPDVLAAEASLHDAVAKVGVATAAMLPNLTLSANVGTNDTALSGLFSGPSLFWSAAAAIAQPLFRGGALFYQRRAALEERDVQLANYRQTVLSAFVQVADALVGLGNDAEPLAAQEVAARSTGDALRLVQIDYDAGLATYLQVLTADTQDLQARLGVIDARAQQLTDVVTLFVALGGGWWTSQAPAVSSPTQRFHL